MALLVLYFGPSDLLTPEESFAAFSNRLMVGPVVETLVYSKIPKSVSTSVRLYYLTLRECFKVASAALACESYS